LNLWIKAQTLRGIPMHLVGVSEWISNCAKESRVFRGQPITTIRNAVDPERFFPMERAEARARLGVRQGARVIMLSVAGDPQDTRKGLDIAVQALQGLEDFPLFLLPLGIAGESSGLRGMLACFNGLPPRHVNDDALLRDYYAAADVVWHPSRADTSSMVALEAFACGTPVITAAVGGVPEVVSPKCGMLISPEDPVALANATRRFFQDEGMAPNFHNQLASRATAGEFERFLSEHETVYRGLIP
jgi:glycosyltransferase involved in cell wall biosynthesis